MELLQQLFALVTLLVPIVALVCWGLSLWLCLNREGGKPWLVLVLGFLIIPFAFLMVPLFLLLLPFGMPLWIWLMTRSKGSL